MTPERFQRIDELLSLALERPARDRPAFIRESCGGDENLRIEVESLLASYEETDGFSIRAPSQLAAELLREQAPAGLAKNGTTPGRYQLVGELGSGGMGVVYAAYDPELCRKVALKLMRPETSAFFPGAEARARFLREARAMAQLSHPNVVAVHDVGTAGDSVFIAMEHVEGSTLGDWLEERNRHWGEILGIFLQAGRGLAAAHGAGILHRDFKPGNVLVGKDGRARVVDFGLARLHPADGQEATLTEFGKFLGTPGYMAPEQLLAQPATEKTDQFSFCVALYQGLYGELPFEDEAKQRQVRLPPESSDIPAELRQVILRGLSFNPTDRHESMDTLLGALEHLGSPNVKWLRRHLAAVLVGAIFISAAAGLYSYARGQARSSTAPVKSLVVLPFLNASAGADAEYLSDGIAETLIDNLSQISELKVITRETAFRHKGKAIDPQELGRALAVDAVLTGRVQQRGGELVIHAELVHAVDRSQLWEEKYNRKFAGLLAVEEEIANAISDKLRPRLSSMVQRKVTKRSTDNSEAHLLYLRGRYFWNMRTQQSMSKSVEYLQRAIDLDRNYALAYAALADSYQTGGMPNWPREENFAKAEAAALRALAIDDGLAEAHASLGLLKMQQWDWPTAKRELKRAIELNPNYAPAHNWYGMYLDLTAHNAEAFAEFRQAQQLDPASAIYATNLGWKFCERREYDRAIAQFQVAEELNPKAAQVHATLARCYFLRNMYPEAISELEKGLAINPTAPHLLSALARTYARQGKKDRALIILDQLKKQDQAEVAQLRDVSLHPKDDVPAPIALLYIELKDKESAFEWLEKAYQRRSPWLGALKCDVEFDPLRSDPRFENLIRRVGLPS